MARIRWHGGVRSSCIPCVAPGRRCPGAFDMETIANLTSWFQATNISAIVRIHKSFAHLIPGILDQGIMGIQVSEVENAEEARAIVHLAKYPPIGNRAPGRSRSNRSRPPR